MPNNDPINNEIIIEDKPKVTLTGNPFRINSFTEKSLYLKEGPKLPFVKFLI